MDITERNVPKPRDASEPADEDVEAVLAQGEAGIGDIMAAYDRVESIYIAATIASTPSVATALYSTHT